MYFNLKKCSYVYMILTIDVLWILINEISLHIIGINITAEYYFKTIVVNSLTVWETIHNPIYYLANTMILPDTFHEKVFIGQIILVYVLVLVYVFILLSVLCNLFLFIKDRGQDKPPLV